jgi:hypothetical protein
MKLNFGCGHKKLSGYVNIDARPEVQPDAVVDVTDSNALDRLMLPRYGRVEEILAVHFLEHLHCDDALAFLRMCHCALRTGGKLILELPDIAKCALNLLNAAPLAMTMFGLYGDPRERGMGAAHLWGYTPDTLYSALRAAGFERDNITVTHDTRWHPVGRYNRDMRAEAVR